MAASSDEWELSKENIQPLQQGRKPDVLKVALSSNPEEIILQERQAFENELRTYTGNDPLSIWCKYIKWVEQNYPKGGKDGHIEQLIQKCLSILKDKTEYYDDKRFIEIWLKFANMVTNTNEIYQFMYSNKIGCKSAVFFAEWAWELESQGNISKADQVLNEGIRRKAEPFEKLKSYWSDFEMRVAAKVMANSEQMPSNEDPGRSAFAMLKPVKKKNAAPVVRVGDKVVSTSKVSMTVGRQQAVPKSNLPSGKVPFKIYSGENIQSSLPNQTENAAPFVLHADISKENEKHPSKWNKVKLKQMPSASRRAPISTPGFKLHCDEPSPSGNTPRSVPKSSNILRVRKEPTAPPLALFEPPDPMKKPMYDKEKVYGGGEEFSLEEIRAAEWFKKKKELEKERQMAEQKRLICKQQEEITRLKQQVELLKIKQSSNESDKISESKNVDQFGSKNFSAQSQRSFFQNDKSDAESSQDTTASVQKELLRNSKLTSTFSEASCIVRDFYNDTISHPTNGATSTHLENGRKPNPSEYKTSMNQRCSVYQDPVTTVKHEVSAKENALPEQCERILSSKPAMKFKFQDPTETISQSREKSRFLQGSAVNNSVENPFLPKQHESIPSSKPTIPFKLFQDPTEVISQSKENSKSAVNNDVENAFLPQQYESIPSSQPIMPFKLFQDPTEVISQSKENPSLHKVSAVSNVLKDEKEDAENIPPKGYIQETNKRELNGILQPSKNILFVPLEYQEQEESDEEQDIEYDENNHALQNETLIPPCNTEQFLAAPFLASTPRTHVKTEQEILEDDYLPKSIQPSNEACSAPLLHCLDIAACPKENKSSLRDHSTFRGYTGQLSVIMESSREIYKSSSSSGSSASATRLSHFDQCFSQERSGTQKQFSRTDAFKGPKSVVQVNGPEFAHYSNERENTFGVFKEPKSLSQKMELPSSTKRENNLKPSFNNEGIVKKSVVNSLSDAYINQGESKQATAGNKGIYCTNIDPFDSNLHAKLLGSLPVECLNFHVSEKALGHLEIKDEIQVGDLMCVVENEVSEGAFGKVYMAKTAKSSNEKLDSQRNAKIALKLCKKSSFWELYICNILHNRLNNFKKIPNVQSSVMEVISAEKFSNALVLTSEFCQQGTLLDFVNFYTTQHLPVPEYITMYLTYEMLHIVSQIHECHIIHNDIKPDNILVRDITNPNVLDSLFQKTIFLKLIDFGRGVDLNVFERGVCFEAVLKDGCIEMKEKKPWVFQYDWYGLCNCIHVLLFQEYMKVKKNPDGRWTIEKRLKRYWDQNIWSPLFDELLNIPACYQEPDILKYTSLIESKLKTNAQAFKLNLLRLLNSFMKK